MNDETRRLYAHDLEMPVILILASFKLTGHQGRNESYSITELFWHKYSIFSTFSYSIFIGRVQLGNIDWSRIYVNLDTEDVSVFRNRFQHSVSVACHDYEDALQIFCFLCVYISFCLYKQVSRDWCLGSVMCFKQANAVTISSYEHLQFKKLMLYIIFYKIPCCLAIWFLVCLKSKHVLC